MDSLKRVLWFNCFVKIVKGNFSIIIHFLSFFYLFKKKKRFLFDRYVEGTCPRCQFEVNNL